MPQSLSLARVENLVPDFQPVDVNVIIREFQAAIATELLLKGGFAYNEAWYQEFLRVFSYHRVSYKKYEDKVIVTFLGCDLVEHKKKRY